ncbi:MAG: sulfite exporter TauE/SafE family protein [Burkholderiaceae bacterium]|nr:sulfite exporter TauE/SafE family protein [Burkholderiaceae bacterium]
MLSPIADPVFYLAAVPAVVLTGVSKAGLGGAVGVLGVPIMALAIGVPQAAAIMLPILLAMDAMGLVAFRRRFDAEVLRHAIPAAMVGIAVGTLLFRVVDERWIKGLIGLESIVFALAKFREGSRAWTGLPAPLSVARSRFWPAVAGFTSFISHAGGPPMMQLLLPLRLDPVTFVGTTTWFFAAVNAAKLVPYAWLGQFDATNLGTSLALLPVVPVGYFAGLRLLRWIKPATFVRVATWALLGTGLKLTWDALI